MLMFGAQAAQTSQTLRLTSERLEQSPRSTPISHTLPITPVTPTSKHAAPIASDDDPILEDSPELETWLAGLDADPIRGRLNVRYAQYSPALQDAGLLELNDLLDLKLEKLAELGNMNWGTASRLLKFALTDHNKLLGKGNHSCLI